MSDYRALYRKWRPRDFDDVSGQAAVTDVLKYEVASGKLSHAYLFCGSRGTGKTSCAKILAKAVNCEAPVGGNPCNRCAACLAIDAGTATDVIEMDAASNNGVDNVRDLRDEIVFTPAELKYRVYIIDEVHMMSPSAFNALLKTLEEPPAYVLFILATTEFHKLPTTIVSRCQRFDFRRISSDAIVARLEKISAAEGIDLRPDGARIIARASLGGMRDAVSLLELCAGSRRTIDGALASEIIGTGNREMAYTVIGALADADVSTVYRVIHDLVMAGGDLTVFWQDLIDAYRDMTVVKTSDLAKEYLDLTDTEFEKLRSIADRFSMARLWYHTSLLSSALTDLMRAGGSRRSVAEITLARMCDEKLSATPEALALRVEELEKQLSLVKLGAGTIRQEARPAATSTPSVTQTENKTPKSDGGAARPYAKWGQVLERIAEVKKPLSVQFIGAEVTETAPHAYRAVMSSFFAKKLSASESDLAVVRGAIAEAEGCQPSEIRFVVEEKAGNTKTAGNGENPFF